MKLKYANHEKLEDLKNSKKLCKIAIVKYSAGAAIFGSLGIAYPNIASNIMVPAFLIGVGICYSMMAKTEKEIYEYKIKQLKK